MGNAVIVALHAEPEREPAYFCASLRIGKRRPGFRLSGDAARLLAVVMALCTVITGIQLLAGLVRLARKAGAKEGLCG